MTGPHEPTFDHRLLSPAALMHRIAEDMAYRFDGVFGRETIDAYVAESFELLDRTSRIKNHLPALTERFTRDRLNALARHQELVVSHTPEVLFVCVHNAGRSQMAAALLQHHANGQITVRSAGSAPASEINPAVIEAMAEIGLDLSEAFPKPLTSETVQASDVVITMGCGDACPVFAGKRYLDWQLNDPAGQGLDAVRAIRDEIDRRIQDLVTDLLPATLTPAQGG